ncbi:TonB-dependent receptor [Parabacteroides goldsteinii]|nr:MULTISPECIES: TonB-dependent receptor [Parabacteroides]MCM0721128.1 TonB-dependent receptor [Parabacteroides sp. W1-Q-101]GKG76729.1 TonB-dependent receptor [Parabacteroides goldsteinii]GKG79848.1 TonB-dependent receptor [Parabacteroides goldsteinii]
MKTIYNVKALCVVALLGTTATMSAQEDTSKKQNLDREMTLEREYDPTVQDASKVNTLPVIKEPEVKKMPIDYANFTVAADPAKEISLLPSGNIMTDIQYNKRRGYFNFGGGTYLNLNGDLGYHILSTDKDQLNIWFSHRSTNGKVKYLQFDEKVKAKLNDNMGGLNFKHNFDKLFLKMGLKYGYSGFNYYGFPIYIDPASSALPDPVSDVETNQVAQTIKANVGVESKADAPVGYLLNLDYTNFSYKYGMGKPYDGTTEGTFTLDFGLNASFGGNQRVGLDGNFQYFNYSLPKELEITEGEKVGYGTYFDNFATATLSPYYKVEGDNWHIKLGVNAMFFSGEYKKAMVSPNISADVEVADKTVLYLNANGKLQSNSMYDLFRTNRYSSPISRITPSRNWLDGILGIKSGVAPGFWFDVFGGYKITNNNYFFVPVFNNENDAFGNFSAPLNNVNTNQLFIGANLKYSYQQLFEISLKGVYNNWDAKLNDNWENEADKKIKAFGMPEMEITAGVTVRPLKNLSASLDYYLATGRETCVSLGQDLKMDNINELNLTGAYNFNDTFGLYLKLNNVLFQKYELYYGYPLQKFSAMIGVNINF